MRKFSVYFFVVALSLGAFTACNDNDDDDGSDAGYGDVTGIINDYVDKTVLPTYKDMKDKAWTLYETVAALSTGEVTNVKISAACDAWRATRIPWEQSESFLFGPAALQNLDPLLDSWPLDKGGIDQVLVGGNYNEDALGAGIRGFHTIEYLLFENGQPRTNAPFTGDYLEYLTVVTKVLRDDCIKLWSSWAGADELSGKDAEAMEEIEFEPASPSYSYQFNNAGKPGSVYFSTSEAIDAIIDGCVDIATEVGSQKIGGPNGLATSGETEQAVLEVESWYSWNSIDDYANNITSIKNSYLGGRGLTQAGVNSLSAYVKSQDATLDAEILNAIDTALKAIRDEMERPFRSHLTGTNVDDAMTACGDLADILESVKNLKK
jgi:hypothetical protein